MLKLAKKKQLYRLSLLAEKYTNLSVLVLSVPQYMWRMLCQHGRCYKVDFIAHYSMAVYVFPTLSMQTS